MFLQPLNRLRQHLRIPGIQGIPSALLSPFQHDTSLHHALQIALPQLESVSSSTDIQRNLQSNILPFYNETTRSPYIPLCAKGPWVITENGAVVYDVGGYGMLGFGHSPDWVSPILAKEHVMTNIMTPHRIHQTFTELLKERIGASAGPGHECPYSRFAFLNSGSEGIELAMRVANARARSMHSDQHPTDKPTLWLTLKQGFHGRTYMAAQLSDSTAAQYHRHLQTFPKNNVSTIDINDVTGFIETFRSLQRTYTIQGVCMEPVMGEGNPGIQIDRTFYDTVRKHTADHHAALVIDSVQAGIRTNGHLSVVDYPDLQGIAPPDIEVFSKIIHSGQYPLSIVATTEAFAQSFPTNLYGNTMTGNPKALDIGYETLKRMDSSVIRNIQEKGVRFKQMLSQLHEEYPQLVTHVTGKGLLLALHIDPVWKVDAHRGLEYICRRNGLNVIHGGDNALRFTPHVLLQDTEITLIYHLLRKSLEEWVCDVVCVI